MDRNKHIQIRVNESEKNLFFWLAKERGQQLSEVLRELVSKEAKAQMKKAKPKTCPLCKTKD